MAPAPGPIKSIAIAAYCRGGLCVRVSVGLSVGHVREPCKTAEPIEMPCGRVTIPEGESLEENVPDKPNAPNNCELDWTMQRLTTGADA